MERKGSVKEMAQAYDTKVNAIHLEEKRVKRIQQENRAKRKRHLEERLRKRRGQKIKERRPGSQYYPTDRNEETLEMLGPLPAPFPTRTSKQVLYSRSENTELFKDLEEYATHLESKNVDFPVLMKILFIRELTELERVRILFHWISSQDLNAIDFPNHVPDDSPYGHLKAIKEYRSDYATLFQRLCRSAGIHCKVIRGYLKCFGYFPDHSFQNNPSEFLGSWNAVFVHGEWRFIDTCWGARYIKGQPGEDKLVYEYDEHYFLTDPDKLITSHFPKESEWQLLLHPKSLDQFENAVQNWSHFYDFKLSHASHYKGLIATDSRGNVQIKLRVPMDDYEFSFTVYPRHKNQTESITCGDALLQNAKAVFDIHLPNFGDYILILFVTEKGGTIGRQVCRYQLHYP